MGAPGSGSDPGEGPHPFWAATGWDKLTFSGPSNPYMVLRKPGGLSGSGQELLAPPGGGREGLALKVPDPELLCLSLPS